VTADAAGGPLPDLPATELRALLARGEVSAREVVAAHLERIAAVNPALNAIVTLVPEPAMAAAAAADDAFARSGPTGPLHGLPVAHKDLVQTRGVRTTFGSPIFASHVPDVDDLLVTRFRLAGAIAVGKTNTPEFGAGSHTFNPVFGVTRNPYDPARTCGGSSGGAAVALRTGMVALADGSDTGGSLRNPAGYNNVVGLRPSPGRVPTWPTRNPWAVLPTLGPMGRTVADVALTLSVLAGPDRRAPMAMAEPGATFAPPLPERDLRGLRVAFSPTLGGLPVDGDVLAVVEPHRQTFTDLGCVVEDADPGWDGADEAFETLRALGFELGYGGLYDRQRDQLKASVRWNIEAGRALSGVDIGRATRLHAALFDRVATFFESYDLLATVVSQVAPFPVEVEWPTEVAGVAMASYIEWMRSCSRVTVTSCPAISVPAGFTPGGLPVGIQLVARHGDEFGLLQVAAAFEAATGFGTRAPTH
jgi:amidase